MISSSARRNTEVSLLLLSGFIAVGGYWLVSLARDPTVPKGILGYAAAFAVIYAVAHFAVRKLAPSADPLFLPIAAMLNAIGFVMIARLEPALRVKGIAGAQVRWLAVAVVAMVATLYLVKDVRSLARFRYSLALAGVILLILPSLPGLGRTINGSRLWIKAGGLTFQPAELGKVALVIFFAGFLSERRELLAVATRRIGPLGVPAMRHFGPVLLAWVVSLLIMVNQRDLGSSLLFLAIFIAMVWIATARPAYLIAGTGMFVIGAWVSARLFPHVLARFQVWRDPFAYFNDRGYQVAQSLFALATGGVWGTGLGLGRPDLIRFSVHTDFIFSAIGEELGLAGGIAILTAFALFASRGFGLATRCRDDFSKLLVAGLTTALGLQVILIVGGVINLIPLTGVTLPFVSYGGSSLLSNFVLVALLMRASAQAASETEVGPPTELTLPAGGGR